MSSIPVVISMAALQRDRGANEAQRSPAPKAYARPSPDGPAATVDVCTIGHARYTRPVENDDGWFYEGIRLRPAVATEASEASSDQQADSS